jgi:uncharacterized membrane protein
MPAGYRLSRVLLAGVAALFSCVGPPSLGGAQEAAQPLSVWEYSLYKTITYEFFANLADVPLYYIVLGGTGAGALFNTVNVLTAGAAYYTYEVTWNLYGPSIRDRPPSEVVEVEITKTLLYRVVSTARNLVLAYAFTESATASLSFALINNVVDIAIYGFNEYAWYVYGPAVAPGTNVSFPEMASELGLPAPSDDTYRVAAISLGAVAGVIIVNVLTGGTATPVLLMGTSATVEGTAAYLGGVGIAAFAAVGGGYAVDWLYEW